MSLYSFHLPVRLLAGLDSLMKVPEAIHEFGDRVMLLSESSLKSNAQYQTFLAQIDRLHLNIIHFDDMETCHTVDALHNILQKTRVSRPQVLIAMGGIRTLGLARIMATLGNSKVSLERFLSGEKIKETGIPLIDVPSSCRDPYCGTSHVLFAESFIGRPLWIQQEPSPVRLSVFDPKLHLGIPQKQSVLFLYDHILLCTDILSSSMSNPISEANAQASIIAGVHALRSIASQGKDLKANLEACAAGALGVTALAASSPGLGTAVSTVLHTRFHIPKSLAAAIILPHLLELYAPYKGAHFVACAQALGADTDSAEASHASVQAAQALRRISGKMTLPSRLGDLKIGQDQIQECAALVMDLSFIRSAPFSITHSHVIDLLRKSL